MSSLSFHNRQVEALRVRDRWGLATVDALAHAFERHGTLTFSPLPSGLYPASGSSALGVSGYGHVWVRDNVYVATALLENGHATAAAGVASALLAFYGRYRRRFEAIVGGAVDPDDVMRRPHVRFDGARLREVPRERWSHAQNDALGYFLWLCAGLARRRVITLDVSALETLLLMTRFFKAVAYWKDEDSGHWEETRKVSASSIGVVVAGLREWLALLGDRRTPIASAALRNRAANLAARLLERGDQALSAILPGECVQQSPAQNRRYDAALLFLVDPLEVVQGDLADLIVSDVQRYLQGPIGVRRYLRDSYWAPDYDRLDPVERTRDYSNDIAVRDVLIESVGDEAQWCVFDPILSAHYGRRFLATGAPGDREAQAHYFNRALAQMTREWKCPELYYLRGRRWVQNPRTPLLWTQANLQLALGALRSTAAAGRSARHGVTRRRLV